MTKTLVVPASERILRRIQSVQEQMERAVATGQTFEVECHKKVRSAYLADLIDVLNEEETAKPKGERVSYNLTSTEAWISQHNLPATA